MLLSKEQIARMVADAKEKAAKKVEDPSFSGNSTTSVSPTLEKDPLQITSILKSGTSGISTVTAQQLAPTPEKVVAQVESPAVSPTVGIPISAPVVSSEITYPGLFELSEKILALDKAIASNHAEFENLLQTIHRNLDKDAQLIHLLKPEDIAIIFRGLKKQTKVSIIAETVKNASSGKGNKGLSKLGLEDL